MKGVVEGYTRHFFTLAHCQIVNDKEMAPRTLQTKMKALEKMRTKRKKKKDRDLEVGKLTAMVLKGGAGDGAVSGIRAELTDNNLTPLERLHAAQRRQLYESGGIQDAKVPGAVPGKTGVSIVKMKGKSIVGKVDLPAHADQASRSAAQLSHYGSGMAKPPSAATVTSPSAPAQYGDPNSTPVVFVSGNGDIQIAMTVEGITCAHCVKIIETVLGGCNGNKSPIDGLLDAAADRVLSSVLIKIDKASDAKRIAFEAGRNLSMVGYSAKPKEMSIVGAGADKKSTMDLGALSTAFDVIASTKTKDMFDWSLPCTCPDNGVLREDCPRHSQMNTSIFEAFDAREKQVTDYMAGCAMKYGGPCTCGPGCRCKDCPVHGKNGSQAQTLVGQSSFQSQPNTFNGGPMLDQLGVEQPAQFFGMELPNAPALPRPVSDSQNPIPANCCANTATPLYHQQQSQVPALHNQPAVQHQQQLGHGRASQGEPAQRNPSVISFGNNLRHMSMSSEATFGRAMSGLSALSIDWENLDDFDVDVDHSAHINYDNGSPVTKTKNSVDAKGGDAKAGARRSSLRRPHLANGEKQSEGAHVSFRETA